MGAGAGIIQKPVGERLKLTAHLRRSSTSREQMQLATARSFLSSQQEEKMLMLEDSTRISENNCAGGMAHAVNSTVRGVMLRFSRCLMSVSSFTRIPFCSPAAPPQKRMTPSCPRLTRTSLKSRRLALLTRINIYIYHYSRCIHIYIYVCIYIYISIEI